MENKIKNALAQLEKDKEIKILFACETGSRAWGFASPDSDYDVRFIYKQPLEWYLKLGTPKDTIEFFLENNELDLSGWELKKSLQLLWKSNAAILERIQSPVTYILDENFQKGILDLAQQSYSKVACMFHYLSLAKKMFEEVNEQESFKFKTFFYALRSSLACQWILEKETYVPIEFKIMLEELEFSESLKQRIKELIDLKSTKTESYFHKGEKECMELMNDILTNSTEKASKLPGSKPDMEQYNHFFKSNILT